MNSAGLMSSRGCPICGGQWCRPVYHSIEERIKIYGQVVTLNNALHALTEIVAHKQDEIDWNAVKVTLKECEDLHIISCEEAMELIVTCGCRSE